MANSIYKIIEDGIEYNIIEFSDGSKQWSLNGYISRETGPAIDDVDGFKVWYKYDVIHREDGPAIIYSDGIKEYWLNDIHYPDIESDEEWVKLVPIIDIIK